MSPMERDHQYWLVKAREKGAKYIINVCDTFDHENYPVYVMREEDLEGEKKKRNGVNMQKIEAVVNVETGKIVR